MAISAWPESKGITSIPAVAKNFTKAAAPAALFLASTTIIASSLFTELRNFLPGKASASIKSPASGSPKRTASKAELSITIDELPGLSVAEDFLGAAPVQIGQDRAFGGNFH